MNEPKENIDLSGMRVGVPATSSAIQVLFPEMPLGKVEQTKPKRYQPGKYDYKTNMRRYRERKIAAVIDRIGMPICSCGNNERQNFKLINEKWLCKPCLRVQVKRNERLRKSRSERKRTLEKLAVKFGPDLAAYWAKHRKEGTGSVAKVRFIQSFYPKLSRPAAERLSDLNQIAGLPLNNLGWTCSKCRVYSRHYAFFDIDHKEPKSKGGKDRRVNRQILCPNCHRRKTLHDLYGITECLDELR